jgi:hypothetical protein
MVRQSESGAERGGGVIFGVMVLTNVSAGDVVDAVPEHTGDVFAIGESKLGEVREGLRESAGERSGLYMADPYTYARGKGRPLGRCGGEELHRSSVKPLTHGQSQYLRRGDGRVTLHAHPRRR